MLMACCAAVKLRCGCGAGQGRAARRARIGVDMHEVQTGDFHAAGVGNGEVGEGARVRIERRAHRLVGGPELSRGNRVEARLEV